jgi:hypothetical protein
MFYNKKIFKRCFCYRGRYWYKNIKRIPLYFKLMHHLIKHGYDEYATWETFNWFIDTMKEILKTYREGHIGYPVASFDNEELQKLANIAYDADIDKMIVLLDKMDEEYYSNVEYSGDYRRINNEMNESKDEFFQLFTKHFYSLWD